MANILGGMGLGLILAVIIALPIFLYRNSLKYHNEHHTTYSELMCDHCQTRRNAVSIEEALRRWPMRILGDKPPKGEG